MTPPRDVRDRSMEMERYFLLAPFSEEEYQFVLSHRHACKQIITNKQLFDPVFWTRVCITSWDHISQKYGGLQGPPRMMVLVFKHLLEMLYCKEGAEQVIEFMTRVYQFQLLGLFNLKPLEKLADTGTKILFEPFFSHLQLQRFWCNDLVIDKINLTHTITVGSYLSGCIARTMMELERGENTNYLWKMPASWMSPNYEPSNLEKYLLAKWKTDFADAVLISPRTVIGWWNIKTRRSQESDVGSLSRVQNFPWKREFTQEKSWLPPFLVAEKAETLFDLLKMHHPEVEKPFFPEFSATRLLFKCFNLSMPPILSAKYHNGYVEGQHSLNLSAWFASWCALMDGPKLTSLLLERPTNNCPGTAIYFNKVLSVKRALSHWSVPETILPSDQPATAKEFLEAASVIRQFRSNYTIRQQWLALALSVVLEFEIEAAPLQFWPVPKKMVKSAVEVLSYIRMTKESILLGLKAHEDDNFVDIDIFFDKLLPTVLHHVLHMDDERTREKLKGLKYACPPSSMGSFVPSSSWKLNQSMASFYLEHQWNFAFYQKNSPSENLTCETFSVQDMADKILKSWRKREMIPANDSYQPINCEGLLNKKICDFVESRGWNKNGMFIRHVLEALDLMGYIPSEKKEEVLKINWNFYYPLIIITEREYGKMDLMSKISYHCLVLLSCILEYRLDGRILDSRSETLAGNLVHQSLELFESEHLHKLALLVSQYCNFQPISPHRSENKTDHLFLVHGIIKMRTAKVPFTIQYPWNSPCIGPEPTSMAERAKRLRRMLTLKQMRAHLRAFRDPSFRSGAALLQYLFPCYLSLLDSPTLAEEGAQFLYKLLSYMVSTRVAECDFEVLCAALKSEEGVPYFRRTIWRHQNTILQLVNAFADQGSGYTAEILAELFSKMNWCLEKTDNKNETIGISCAQNMRVLIQHFNRVIMKCVEHMEDNCCSVENKLKLKPSFYRLYGLHACSEVATYLMESMFEAEPFQATTWKSTGQTDFSKCLKELTMAANEAHVWHSMLYLRKQWAAACAARKASGCCFAKEIASLSASTTPLSSGNIVQHAYLLFMGNRVDEARGILQLNRYLNNLIMTDLNERFQKMWGGNGATGKFGEEELTHRCYFSSGTMRCTPITHGKNKSKGAGLDPNPEVSEKNERLEEIRACDYCKKNENETDLVICRECAKTDFPKINLFCSKMCEESAMESHHDEEHVLFALDMFHYPLLDK